MRENKGFSLVELILSVAILSIVLTTVTALILSGTKQFTKGNADATMQREAQLVVNQIEDMIIDTNGGVFFNDNTVGGVRELILYNAVSEGGTITYTKEVIEWVVADEEIRYHKWNVVKDNTNNTYADDSVIYSDQLLAENITEFKVDLTDTIKEYDKDGNEIDIVKSVQITVGCTGNDGLVDYATNPVTTLRNRMMLSDSPSVIFPNTPVVEENLSLYISEAGAAARIPIQYPGTIVKKNKYYNIYAIVNDTYDVNSLVNWSILEADTLSTIDSTGKLWVNDLEPNMTLTIVATYKDNPSKKVTGVVSVASGREIESVRIIPLSSHDVPFEPNFDSEVKLDGFTEDDMDALVYNWTISEPTWATCPDNNQSKFTMFVKQDVAIEKKILVVTLTVSAPSLGCTEKSATYNFLVPSVGDTKDSYIERDKHLIEYNFTNKNYQGVGDPKYTVYFCDEQGNRLSQYDYLVDQVVKIESCWAGGFTMQVLEGLPANTAFYLKVIVHCVQDGNICDYERIFYIPAVELLGQTTKTTWKGFNTNHSGLDYNLYGYYVSAGGWNTSKYTIEVQEIISNAPEGVTITPHISDSYIVNSLSNLMRSEVSFELSGDTSGIDISTIKVKSIRVKIQMTGEEIATYSTLIFTD